MSRGKHHEPEPEQEQSHDQWLADQFGDQLNNLDWANMTEEERAAAEAMIELLGEEYTQDWQIGFSIGSIPDTPWGTDDDTGEHESIKKK